MMRRVADLIAENEFWLLVVYGVPLLFARNLPPLLFFVALATIPFFWIARRVSRGAWTVVTPLDLPLVILLILGLVSVGVSDERATSVLFLGEWIGGIALLYGIVNGVVAGQHSSSASRDADGERDSAGTLEVGDRKIAAGVWAILLLGAAMAVVGLLGVRVSVKFLPLPFLDLLPKVDLDALNPRGFTPNIVAGALAPLVPLALVWAWIQKRTVLQVGVAALALLLLSVVVLTQSRGAILALVLACALLPLLYNPRRLWVVPAVLVPLLLLIFLLGPSNVMDAVVVSDSQGSARERVELWDRALRMMRDFPFTGIGLGLFEQTVVSLYPLFYSRPDAPLPHAHNLYLEMGVEFGVGGFVAFIALLTSLLGVGWQAIRGSVNRAQRWLAAGLLAGVIVFMGHSMLDAIFVSTKVSVIIWSLMGLVLALFFVEREVK